jgi:anaerobic selenocysteine-containing dehydrogenase/ferredoxin-NADP reductase
LCYRPISATRPFAAREETVAELASFCTLCRSHCGTVNRVEGGRLVEIRADPSHPTGRATCAKGRAGPEIVAAHNRILHPMRRTRPKGDADPGWERIGWDEALDLCARRLGEIRHESGPEAVAFAVTTKSGTGIADSIEWVTRFVRVFGSPNIAGAIEICNWHKDDAHKFTFGVGIPTADYANAGLIILWGHNPTSTWLAQADAIARGRAGGASLIVVDPRPTPLARDAEVWLRVRPGTDAALALGLANLLIEEGGLDEPFVRRWTNAALLVRDDDGTFLRHRDLDPDGGDAFVTWDEGEHRPVVHDTRRALPEPLADRLALRGRFEVGRRDGGTLSCRPAFDRYAAACRAWTPSRVASVTGIAEDRIRAAAGLISGSRRIAYHAWNGVGQSITATQTERAIATLYALRGCFDDVGCNRILAKQPSNKVDGLSLIPPEQLAKAIGLSERPLGPAAEGRVKSVDVYRALSSGKPYPVRALVGFGTNHLVTQPDTNDVRRGLEAAEFHVHCDIVETPTARYADVLLPVSAPWEREGLRTGFEISEEAENLIHLRPAAVAPLGEARSDMEIVFDLATRLGFGDRFFGGDVDAGYDHVLEPLGTSVAALRARGGRLVRPLSQATRKYAAEAEDGVRGFATETRKVELYSEKLHRHGYDAVPTYEPKAPPSGRFPLVLTSVKNGFYLHSQHRGIASLRRRGRAPVLELHPSAASARNIGDGEWVRVVTEWGAAKFVARLDEGLDEGVMTAEFGWWEGCEPLGKPGFPIAGPDSSNFNTLLSGAERDPVSGSVAHKAVACDVVAIAQRGVGEIKGFRPFRIAALRRETDFALTIEFEPAAAIALPDYEPGQYVRVRVRHPDTGELLTRAYSLTGPAQVASRSTYQICVGRAADPHPDSMQHLLHGRVRVGDVVELELPQGLFTLPTSSSVPVTLVATGIGIAPFLGYLRSLGDGRGMPAVRLLYGCRNSLDHAFGQELAALSGRLERLSIRTFYSRPLPTDVQGEDFDVAGRIGPACVSAAEIEAQTRFYFCGSNQMIHDMRQGLTGRGVRSFDVFSEAFTVSAIASPAANRVCQVTFLRSKVKAEWRPAMGSLLTFAEGLGIKAPSGCGVGQCGSCAVRLVSGSVAYPAGLSSNEPDDVLTCQGVPSEDLVLDL